MVKISLEWVTGSEQGKSTGRIATFSLWTGLFTDSISSIHSDVKVGFMDYSLKKSVRILSVRLASCSNFP